MTSATAAATAVAQCVVMATATCGNVLIIVSVLRFRQMRTVGNYFIASLAGADLAVAVLVMPPSIVEGLSADGWTYGNAFCHLWISVDVTCCTASILHLCSIAVDRYLVVSRPLEFPAGTSWTRRRAVVAIGVVWLCSAAISFVPVNLGWYSTGTPPTLAANCSWGDVLPSNATTATIARNDLVLVVDPPQNNSAQGQGHGLRLECDLNPNAVYAVVSSMTSFFLPLVVMTTVYAKIFRIARRQLKSIHQLQKVARRPPGGGSALLLEQQQKSTVRRHSANWKPIKTLGTLIGLFCACWVPFFVVYLVRPFAELAATAADTSDRCAAAVLPVIRHDVIHVVTWLGYANSAVNPFVYGLMSRDFRAAFRRLVPGCRLVHGRTVRRGLLHGGENGNNMWTRRPRQVGGSEPALDVVDGMAYRMDVMSANRNSV